MAVVHRRGALSVTLAVALSLMLAGQALGAAWSSQVALTATGNGRAGGLAVLSDTTAVAVFQKNGNIVSRRTTDSGLTWKSGVRVATGGRGPHVAGLGSDVDVAWVKSGKVRYAHSVNSGKSFRPSIALGTIYLCTGMFCLYQTEPSVARGPNGVVVVGWVDADLMPVVRVSTNNGVSFSAKKQIDDLEVDYWAGVQVAVGTGVIYAAYGAYNGTAEDLLVSRSTDNGATWSDPQVAATDLWTDVNSGTPSITAAGSHAYLAYPAGTEDLAWIAYNRTKDGGASWLGVRDINSPSEVGLDPVIALRKGVVRVAFLRRTSATTAIFYRQSSNGTTWTAGSWIPFTPSSSWLGYDVAGIGQTGATIVLYTGCGECDVYVNVRLP